MQATVLEPSWLRPADATDEPCLPPTIGDAFGISPARPLAPPDAETLVRVGALGPTAHLIDDGTLWVMRRGARIGGYAAWTFRTPPYGVSPGAPPSIRRPGVDPALAFGIEPENMADQAPGRALFTRLEAEMRGAGYTSAELVVSPSTAAFYLALGYSVLRELEILLPGATVLRALRLRRRFEGRNLSIV